MDVKYTFAGVVVPAKYTDILISGKILPYESRALPIKIDLIYTFRLN